MPKSKIDFTSADVDEIVARLTTYATNYTDNKEKLHCETFPTKNSELLGTLIRHKMNTVFESLDPIPFLVFFHSYKGTTISCAFDHGAIEFVKYRLDAKPMGDKILNPRPSM